MTTDPSHTYFVVGAERSGSTLLRLMLACHPEIAMVGQFEYAILGVGDDGALPDPAAFARDMEVDRIFQASGLSIDPALGYRELVHDLLEQTRAAADAKITGGMVHFEFDRLVHLWPDARFVHLVRDGRDVARSAIAMGWAGDMWHAGDGWLHAEHMWDEMSLTIPDDRRHELRYEDLVTSPEPTLRALTAFLGVDFSPAMFDYPEVSDYPAPDPARLDQWRHKLDASEIRLAEARLGPMLEARGYELSGGDTTPPSPWERRRLVVSNRLYKARHRLQRYGASLWLKELLTRRLGMHDRWRGYKIEMNELEQAELMKVPPAVPREPAS